MLNDIIAVLLTEDYSVVYDVSVYLAYFNSCLI